MFDVLALSGVHVDLGLLWRSAMLWRMLVEHIDDIVVGLVELRLREVGEQAIVAAVTVDDQDFLAAVAGHLIGGLL